MSDATITPRQLAATIVVAASDSLETWRASWDDTLGRYLICDGTADEVEIQAAIDALPGSGGKVQLLEGTFVCSDTIEMDKRVFLVGIGIRSTVIEHALGAVNDIIQIAPPAMPALPFHGIQALTISGNGVAVSEAINLVQNAQDTRIAEVFILGHAGTCINISNGAGWDFLVQNCVIEGNTGIGLRDNGSGGGIITASSFYQNQIGVQIDQGGNSRWIIDNCRIGNSEEHNIVVEGGQMFSISNSWVADAGRGSSTANTYDDIHITTDGTNPPQNISISDMPFIGRWGGDLACPRYGIYIEANGASLVNTIVHIDANIVNPATGPIYLDPTLNLRDNVHIANSEFEIAIEAVRGNWFHFPTNGGWTESHVNGFATQSPGQMLLGTTVAVNSRALVYCEADGLNYATNHLYGCDWSKKMIIIFNFGRYGGDAQCIARVQLKHVNAEGVLAVAGIGIQISNYTIVGESYGVGRGTVALGAVTSLKNHQIMIVHEPDVPQIKWYIDRVLAGTQSTANNIPQAVNTNPVYLVDSIINGIAGGVDCRSYWMQIKVWQGMI